MTLPLRTRRALSSPHTGPSISAGPGCPVTPPGGRPTRETRTTNAPFLRRAPRVLATALAAGLLAGAPPAASREAAGAVVLPSSEIEHLFGATRGVFTAADGTVYYGKGVVVLSAIAFESGSDRPTPESRAQIAELAGALGKPFYHDSIFSVEGHADSTGSAAWNEELSLRRARQVVRILVDEHGVPAGRLTVCGRGESAPREGLRHAPENGLNRRMEVVRLVGVAVTSLRFAPPANPSDSGAAAPVACADRRRHL